MRLTKKVLIEKKNDFSDFTTHGLLFLIEDETWEKACKEIKYIHEAETSTTIAVFDYDINYIASKILSPMIGNNTNYVIIRRDIIFYGVVDFFIPYLDASGTFNRINKNDKDYLELKDFICNIWNRRTLWRDMLSLPVI